MHVGRRLLPLVDMPKDAVAVLTVACGFGIAIAATARLGMVRTYFGVELGFDKPRWITGFPYSFHSASHYCWTIACVFCNPLQLEGSFDDRNCRVDCHTRPYGARNDHESLLDDI